MKKWTRTDFERIATMLRDTKPVLNMDDDKMIAAHEQWAYMAHVCASMCYDYSARDMNGNRVFDPSRFHAWIKGDENVLRSDS